MLHALDRRVSRPRFFAVARVVSMLWSNMNFVRRGAAPLPKGSAVIDCGVFAGTEYDKISNNKRTNGGRIVRGGLA